MNANAEKLSLFIPKSPVHSIKSFIPEKNITYFENSSGKLYMNKGANNILLINDDQDTKYNTYLSKNARYLLIEKIPQFLTNLSLRKKHKIYIHEVGSKKVKLIGIGQAPKFHQENTIISFISPEESFISLKSQNGNLLAKINYSKRINPYFVPERVITDSKIYFTELNTKGKQEVVSVNLKTKQRKKVLLAKKIESSTSLVLCGKKQIFISIANKDETILYNLNGPISKTKGTIISSLECHDNQSLVYIKKVLSTKKEEPLISKVYNFSLKVKKEKELASLTGLSSLIKNQNNFFVFNNSKYYRLAL